MTQMEEGFPKPVKIWYLNLCSYLLQAYLKKNIHGSPEALPEANMYDLSYIGIKNKQKTTYRYREQIGDCQRLEVEGGRNG